MFFTTIVATTYKCYVEVLFPTSKLDQIGTLPSKPLASEGLVWDPGILKCKEPSGSGDGNSHLDWETCIKKHPNSADWTGPIHPPLGPS